MNTDPAIVGAFGWWFHDNQGDSAMLTALRTGLAPHRVVPLEIGFPMTPDYLRRLNRFDFLLLGGGTLIPGALAAPFDTFDQWSPELTSPLGALGIGVDPMADEATSAVRAVMDRASFFYARDAESKRLLDAIPMRGPSRVIYAPDLSFAYPIQARHETDGSRAHPLCGVNLRRADTLDPQPWLEALATLELPGGRKLDYRAIGLSSFPSWSEQALLSQLDPAADSRFRPGAFDGLDLMIGTAYHSVLFAVQAGVPVLAISYAPKVRNFMRDAGLEAYLLPPDGWDQLPEAVARLLDQSESVRPRLKELRSRFQRDALNMLAEARDEISRSALRHDRSGPTVHALLISRDDQDPLEAARAAVEAQTYEDVAVESVAAPVAAAADHAPLHIADGELITWLRGEAWPDDDALDYLASLLAEQPEVDLVYSDYFSTDDEGNIASLAEAPPPARLHRRNVVGPMFLMRSAFFRQLGGRLPDSPADEYALWLRAHTLGRLQPVHARLMRAGPSALPERDLEAERAVRHAWRASQAGASQAVWRVLDTPWGEQWLIRPAAAAARRLRQTVRPGR